MNSEIRDRYFSGVKGLLDIPLEYDQYARRLWIAFHDEVETKLLHGGVFEPIADWAGKLSGNVLRVAGLFHVIEHGVTVRIVNRETMDKVIQVMKVLVPHAMFALNATTTSGLAKDAAHASEWIVKHEKREFIKWDCQRALQSRFPATKALDPVLSELLGRNIVRPKASTRTMGRPSNSYESNPAIFS